MTSTNAAAVARVYAERATRWTNTLARAMRKAVTAVEVHAVDLLSGSGAPGSYPVPVRTGNLRRAMGSKVTSQTSGIIFNDAGYARAIHSGHLAVGYKGRGRKSVKARPFLDDALKNAQPGRIITQMMSAAL